MAQDISALTHFCYAFTNLTLLSRLEIGPPSSWQAESLKILFRRSLPRRHRGRPSIPRTMSSDPEWRHYPPGWGRHHSIHRPTSPERVRSRSKIGPSFALPLTRARRLRRPCWMWWKPVIPGFFVLLHHVKPKKHGRNMEQHFNAWFGPRAREARARAPGHPPGAQAPG